MGVTSGAKALRKVQLGRESSMFTAVPATTIWRGIAQTPEYAGTKVQPEENIGYTAKTSRQYTTALLGEKKFPETNATFEQMLHVCEGGIKKVGTGVADGVGSGKIYTYPMATGDSNTICS